MSELILPKPEAKPELTRERQENTRDESRLLESVGDRLKPDGVEYLGSFASHVYRNALSGEYVIKCQSTKMTRIPEQIMSQAVREAGRSLMLVYGRKIPKRRGERTDI